MVLDGRSIVNKFENACGENGIETYDIIEGKDDDYIKHNFLDLSEKLIKIMKDEKITDKPGAIADVYCGDKLTIKDFAGDFIYEWRHTKEDRIALLKEAKELRSDDCWKTAIEELLQEVLCYDK